MPAHFTRADFSRSRVLYFIRQSIKGKSHADDNGYTAVKRTGNNFLKLFSVFASEFPRREIFKFSSAFFGKYLCESAGEYAEKIPPALIESFVPKPFRKSCILRKGYLSTGFSRKPKQYVAGGDHSAAARRNGFAEKLLVAAV